MKKGVRIAEVTAENWRAVAGLELDDEQKEFVASNVYSLAESKFDPSARPRAIYVGKRVVGFLMYDLVEDQPPETTIYRFMIGKTQQGKGYGRAALECVLEEIRRIPGIAKISICYIPKNPAAKRFYASFGFVEIGADEDGEMIAELAL
jgi:diamine N-acetyltransferase